MKKRNVPLRAQVTPSTPLLAPSPVHRGLTASKTNTTTTLSSGTEHGRIPRVRPQVSMIPYNKKALNGRFQPQHIRHNKEPHMATPNIHLIEMRDPSIARGDGDILELDVHVILGCRRISKIVHYSDATEMVMVAAPSSNFPRYTCPDVISSVTTWP